MFQSTVFILGAGASCDYGYPTGEELVKRVREESKKLLAEITRLKSSISERGGHHPGLLSKMLPAYILSKASGDTSKPIHALNCTEEECKKLISRLDLVHPPVIDYFLHRNLDVCDLGTFLIGLVILKAEDEYKRSAYDKRFNGQGFNWYRYVLHALMINCREPEDLLKNDVHFITFNYDTSLETHLYSALKETSFFSGSDVVDTFLSGNRVFHVYGKIDSVAESEDIRAESSRQNFFKDKWQYNQAFSASGGIRTIAPIEKVENLERFYSARNVIDAADTVYILGYGFDETNSQNLDLYHSLSINRLKKRKLEKPKSTKKIFFTNYGDKNLVNKRASKIFFGNQTRLLAGKETLIQERGDGALYEKSILKVYGAFESDFDF